MLVNFTACGCPKLERVKIMIAQFEIYIAEMPKPVQYAMQLSEKLKSLQRPHTLTLV